MMPPFAASPTTAPDVAAPVASAAAEVRVCALDDLQFDVPVSFVVPGTKVVVVRTDEGVFALRDRCSHADIALSLGEVFDGEIECHLHGSTFDLRTGRPSCLPATQPVPTHHVNVRDGDVFVTVAAKE